MCHVLPGLIFIIDSNDRERIDEAHKELNKMLMVPALVLMAPDLGSDGPKPWF